jgi:hypothetical protein
MSDTPVETGGLTTDNAPSSQQLPAAATPSASPAPAGTDLLGDPPADQAVFDRGYVDSLRREAQRYRTEAQPYNEVFGVYDEQDRQVWMDLARTWATDPNQAAQIMQQIANGVLGGPEEPSPQGMPAEPIDAADTDQEELTPERVQQLIDAQFSAREAQAAEARAVQEVYSELHAAGFDENTAEGFMVLWNANHSTNGNIAEAVKMTNDYKQSIIDGYVQGRSSGSVPMPSQNGVQATPFGEPIKNLEDAKRATDAYLKERRGA